MTEPTIEEVREWAERQKQHYSGSYGGHGYAAVNAINALLNFLTPKPRTAEEVIHEKLKDVGFVDNNWGMRSGLGDEIAQALSDEGYPTTPYELMDNEHALLRRENELIEQQQLIEKLHTRVAKAESRND